MSIAFGLLPGREAGAVPACTVAAITSQDAGCPNSQAACSITHVFEVGSRQGAGCATLDFGSRAVTITASGELDLGSGTLTLKAGSLTLAGGSQINGLGAGTTAPANQGGMLTIQTTGAVSIQRSGNSRGAIDLSGNLKGGTLLVIAGGAVTIAGRVQLNGLAADGTGGTAMFRADGNITGATLTTMEATGRSLGSGGEFDFSSDGSISFGDAIDVSGGFNGGTVDVIGAGDVAFQRVDASGTGDGGSGGEFLVVAGRLLRFTGPVVLNGHTAAIGGGSGSGGTIDAESFGGNLVVEGDMLVEGATTDGEGGDIDLTAKGSITVGASSKISTASNGSESSGGDLQLDATLDIIMAGILDGSANTAGSVDLNAGRDIVITGPIRAFGSLTGGTGGSVPIAAGSLGKGRLLLANSVDVTGGPCGTIAGCGEAGTADLGGCDVTITTSGAVLASGPRGGQVAIRGRETLTIQGPVNATGNVAGNGTIDLIRRTGRTPLITGAITPAPSDTAQPACTGPNQKGCLIPCPTCGNGVVEFPETCDTAGAPQGCDGCSLFCQTENCTDGLPCTTDTCTPSIGCGNIPIPGCTTTTTTTTSSTTTTRPPCHLDVDGNGTGEIGSDIVYIARRKLSLTPVPPSFRTGHPEIPSDAVIGANVDQLGTLLDVDGNGVVQIGADVVYIARRKLSLTPVPPSFRTGHPEIPSDATIGARIDALCP